MKKYAVLVFILCLIMFVLLTLTVSAQSDLSIYLTVFDEIAEENSFDVNDINLCIFNDCNQDGEQDLIIGYIKNLQQRITAYSISGTVVTKLFEFTAQENDISMQELIFNQKIGIIIDDVKLNLRNSPFIIEGTAMIPLREFSELAGVEVKYTDGIIELIQKDNHIFLQIGSNVIRKNEEILEYTATPIFFAGKTYIPARIIADLLNYNVEWEESLRRLIFTYNIDTLESLKSIIEEYLSGKTGDWSVYVKNINTDASLSINNKPLSPASVIKMFNMVALYDSVNKGDLNLTSAIKSNLNSMITVSSNTASNEIVKKIGNGNFSAGAAKVTALAKELGCIDTKEEHMLYDSTPSTPVYGKNTTSANDCGLILEKIYKRQCINQTYDEEMLNLMLAQTRRNKIPSKIPYGVRIANKTGENSNVEADVGIVFSENCDFIICVIVNGHKGAGSAQSAIAEIAKKTYDYFN